MTRKYVSVLNLLADTTQYLSSKSGYPPCRGVTSYTSPGEAPHPLFRIVDEKSGLRTVYERNYPVFQWLSLPTGSSRTLPYSLELEYLRHSKFHFTPEELDLMDQMLAIQILIWDGINGRRTLNYSFLGRLEEKGYLYELDLDESPEAVESLIRDAYSRFTPWAVSSETYASKVKDYWIAAPVSSLDALRLIHRGIEQKRVSSGVVASYAQLFLPLFATFHLLEMSSDSLDEFTLELYREYRKACPDSLDIDGGDWGDEHYERRDTQEIQRPFSNAVFAWYINPMESVARKDQMLAEDVIGLAIYDLKEYLTRQTVSVISVRDQWAFSKMDLGRVQILLNNDTLDWSQQEESDVH